MPFSTAAHARYVHLINESLFKAACETSADVALLVATLKPLFDCQQTSPLDRKYHELFIELDEKREGFDLFVGEDILTRNIDGLPAFSFTTQERLEETRRAYRTLVETTIQQYVQMLENMTDTERLQYFQYRRQRKEEDRLKLPDHFKPVHDPAVVDRTTQLQLISVRNYIQRVDYPERRQHARRARRLAQPGLFPLTQAVREFEYHRFLLQLGETIPHPETLFRAVEVFPAHRDDLFERFQQSIRTQAARPRYLAILYPIFQHRLPEFANQVGTMADLEIPEAPLGPISLHDHFPSEDPDKERKRLQRVTATYLTTGNTYYGAPYALPVLPENQRLPVAEARAQVKYLFDEQSLALQLLFVKGLRGDHLRQWYPESLYDRFTKAHREALVYLINKQIGPAQAIAMISGKSAERVRAIYTETAVIPPPVEEKIAAPEPQPAREIQETRDTASHPFQLSHGFRTMMAFRLALTDRQHFFRPRAEEKITTPEPQPAREIQETRDTGSNPFRISHGFRTSAAFRLALTPHGRPFFPAPLLPSLRVAGEKQTPDETPRPALNGPSTVPTR